MDDALSVLLLLNRIPHFHGKSIGAYIDIFGSCEKLVSSGGLQELARVNSTGMRLSERIKKEMRTFDCEKEMRAIARHDVRIITCFDEQYPPLLREIATPPLLLYVRGRASLTHERSCGIVGSRRVSLYGRETAERFGFELARDGVTIVSGFARGVDTASHHGVIRARGTTLAVLGCGVDVIYPAENKKLYHDVCSCGAVVSEFSMGTKPLPFHFPQRNRIIAGLSHGVLVVEASAKSGSLITSQYALDEGRHVFSIPGRIDHLGAHGSNNLLKQGASFVSTPADIVEALSVCDEARVPVLSCEESAIFHLLQRKKAYSVEDLCDRSTYSAAFILAVLTRLEMKHLIAKDVDGKFCRIKTSAVKSVVSPVQR